MVKGLFLRSAAWSAMMGAAMMAAGALAVPAQAQDVDRSEMREQRMERRAERQEAQQQQAPQQAQQEQRQARQEYRQQRQAQAAPAQQEQRASRQEWRQQRQAERAQAQQAAPQPQVQRSGTENDRRLERYTEGTQRDRAWARSQTSAPAETGQVQQHGGRDGSTATVQGERNRSYADRHRNGAYRDGNRDGRGWRSNDGSHYRNGTYRSGSNDSWRDGRSADNYRDRRQQRDAYSTGYRSGSRDGYRSGNHRRWDNDWRRDNRYNWSSYRNQHRSLFSAGRYYSPYRNYSYSRLSIGFFLNSGFYGNNYWVNDPWQYRLPEVYGPYKWVRYYDDVLLVDIYTGEVVDVIHDFFY